MVTSVGLEGLAFYLVAAGGGVGPSYVRNGEGLDWAKSFSKWCEAIELSQHQDPWALFMHVLSELAVYV